MRGKEPLVFGHLEDYPVGSLFESRDELNESRIHGPTMAGIWGRQSEGACSIVMSGGYEDDVDELDYVMYTGHGGQDHPGGIQIEDQVFKGGNQALQVTYENGFPVRVTRGFQIANGPNEGYRYDGLYYINHIERIRGVSGFLICRFHLESEISINNLETKLADNLKPGYSRTTRTRSSVNRVNRDPSLSERVKQIYKFRCQVCDQYLEKPSGAIAVGAHIKALGHPHDGPDHLSNLLCLCPNHHAQFDAFSFFVDETTLEIMGSADLKGKKLSVSKKHKIDSEFFGYHRSLYEKAKKLFQA
jgi:putative restriction endonuclease|tara:strand:- start:508 stop:1413 length:906 start_codon:yes stop_codon:yes gene_type:complete